MRRFTLPGALCALIHAQMHEPGHYWERAEGGYEVKVSHGFTALRVCTTRPPRLTNATSLGHRMRHV